jgi:hypothetical protein
VFLLFTNRRGVRGVARKESCEHGVHLASCLVRAANGAVSSFEGTTFGPDAQARRWGTSNRPAGVSPPDATKEER